MRVTLHDIAKQYGREIVFRGVELSLESGSRTAILGPNGSGKSTLLQVIAGAIIPTKGSVVHAVNGRTVPQEMVYKHVSIAAPYLGVYEDLSLRQTIAFHARFKPLRRGMTPDALAELAYLEHALEKPVSHFSSGMKQRLKLALAILSDTPLLLLDEPTSNLDAEAVAWFSKLLRDHADARTLVVASNRQKVEIEMCEGVVEVGSYK
ncbi:MAG: ABC transporter ATP-binding protein [Flavobacteriales bacterium]